MEVFGQRGAYIDIKIFLYNQPACVKQQAFKPRFFLQFFVQGKIAVLVVAEDGVSVHRKVAAYLMHPSGDEFQFKDRVFKARRL